LPKNKFALSKKHEYLILKLSDIPTIDDITHCAWSSDLLNGKFTDFRYNTEDALLMIIEALTRRTQGKESLVSKGKIQTTRATAEEMGEVLENIKKGFTEQIEQNVCDAQVIATLRVSHGQLSQITKNNNVLELGKTYRLAGYKWTACELINKGKTLVIQSHGVTHGEWPGFVMPQFGNGDYYSKSIDGEDISAYDNKMKELYDAIKDAEDSSVSYGKGLFLINKEKASFPNWDEPGSGNYWKVLKRAAENAQSFGAASNNAWLGAVDGSYGAWCVDRFGHVYNINYQYVDYVVAPAFNLDLYKVDIVGDEIMIKAMSAPIGNTILFENPDATSVQKQMFLHYGLYLEEKNGEIEKYVVVHTGTKHFPEKFYISSNDIEADCNIKFYKKSETFEINKICGDLELLQLLTDRMKEVCQTAEDSSK
jgi:hypothetical protein